MTESNLPNQYDAVLGGKPPNPINAAVLGGLAGVKLRLASTSVEQRVAALPDSLNYGEAGLELVLAALLDESLEVRKTAYLLLRTIQDSGDVQPRDEKTVRILSKLLRLLHFVRNDKSKSSPQCATLNLRIQSVLKQIKYWKFLGTTDYTQLQKFLAEGRWKDADFETDRVMLKVASRESEGWLDSDSIKNFPCDDLRTINQLWLDSSNGRFGFSVQKQIWLECGGTIDLRTVEAYGDAPKRSRFAPRRMACERHLARYLLLKV